MSPRVNLIHFGYIYLVTKNTHPNKFFFLVGTFLVFVQPRKKKNMVRSRNLIDNTLIDAQLNVLQECMRAQQLACAVRPDIDSYKPLGTDDIDEHCPSYEDYLNLCMTGDMVTPAKGSSKQNNNKCSRKGKHVEQDEPDDNGQLQEEHQLNGQQFSDNLCKECSVGICQADAGFMVCPECGTVGEACIESGAEWRSFSGADTKLVDPSRCGSSTSNYLMTQHAYSAGTQISSRWRRESDKMHLAQLLQRRLSANPRSRPMRNTFNEFKRATYSSGYSHKIVDDALHLYTSAKKVKNFRADNRKGLMAKCLAETCKKHGVSRSAKEICKDMGISVDIMTKGHRALTKARKVAEESNHKINESSKRTRKTVDQPADFVDRFCSRLSLPTDVTEDVRRVTFATKEMRLVSDNAPLVASACILLVTQHHQMSLTASDIQKIVNISHVTIDKCYKKIREFKDALVG